MYNRKGEGGFERGIPQLQKAEGNTVPSNENAKTIVICI